CSSPESAEYTRVAANLYFLSARAASISAETPDASSSAPGASPVASITSERRESRCPVITITRSGSVCPRWIATTSITSTPFFGVRSPVNTFDGVTTSRQPPQSLEISSNLDFTQRRAAPIPRAFAFVSDSVLRVPKPTSAASMSCNDFAETACVMARNSGCVLDGGGFEAGASWQSSRRNRTSLILRRAICRQNRAGLSSYVRRNMPSARQGSTLDVCRRSERARDNVACTQAPTALHSQGEPHASPRPARPHCLHLLRRFHASRRTGAIHARDHRARPP